jgi:hypothetical protein
MHMDILFPYRSSKKDMPFFQVLAQESGADLCYATRVHWTEHPCKTIYQCNRECVVWVASAV